MKKYKKIPVPATLRDVLEYEECDICKKRTDGRGWKEHSYSVVDIDISMRTGDEYPSGGSGDVISFDVCPDCFENKLIPWMQAQGAEPTIKEWDW